MKKAPTLNDTLILICLMLRARNTEWFFNISTADGPRRQYARVHCLTITSEKGRTMHQVTDHDASTTGLALLRMLDRVVYDELNGWDTSEGSFALVQPLLEQYLKEKA
jgi:hypothetical protein